MSSAHTTPWCLLLSLILHGGLVACGVVTLSVTQQSRGDAPKPPGDVWAGDTFDIDVSLGTSPAPEALAAGPAAGEASDGPEVPNEPTEAEEPELAAKPPATPAPEATPEPDPLPAISAKPDPSVPPTASAAVSRPALPSPSSSSPASPDSPGTASSASPMPVASAAPGGSTESPLPSTFGAAGPRRGVRNLATAFARAMPMASSGDPAWKQLPLGEAGSLELTLQVDERGKISGARPKEASRAPAHLVRLVKRTLTLLRAGRFALSRAPGEAGTETYRLHATIDQVAAAPPDDFSAGPYALGFRAPRVGKAGKATFTLRSGRRITIVVTILRPSPEAPQTP